MGGLFFAAAVSTAIILAILAGLKLLEEALRTRAQSALLEITAQKDALPLSALDKVLRLRPSQIRRVISRSDEKNGVEQLSVVVARVATRDLDRITASLPAMPGVAKVNVTRNVSAADHIHL